MPLKTQFELDTPTERLEMLANLLELALYAPEGEVTFTGKSALQCAARHIAVLSAEISRAVPTLPADQA